MVKKYISPSGTHDGTSWGSRRRTGRLPFTDIVAKLCGGSGGPALPMQVGRGVPDAPGASLKLQSQSGQTTEAAGHFAHRVSLHLACGLLRLAHSGEHKILEHLDIAWIDHIG